MGRDADESLRSQQEIMDQLNQNPLMKRKFISFSSTANAVQVIWNHPD
jgi:hypothetical protein